MNIERKNGVKPNSSRTHGISLSALALSLSIFGLMLTGCATKPTVIAPSCPESTPIPAHLLESDSPAVSDFSKRVQAYLKKVQAFLSESAENKKP